MRDKNRFKLRSSPFLAQGLVLALLVLSLTACGFPRRDTRRADTELQPGWPKPDVPFQVACLPEVRTYLPVVDGAEYVNDDELCLTCHQVYTETFQQNVHHGIHKEGQSCEACHGPGSKHLETRGKEPGMLWDFASMPPAQASEVCLQCHEESACAPGARWRTSVHANACLSCNSCHTSHYNVPPGSSPTTEPGAEARDQQGAPVTLASYQQPLDPGTIRAISNNLNAAAPDTCYRCHGDMVDLQNIAGPHQIGGPNCFNCTTCHDSHGKILDSSRQELCLECHQQGAPTMAWHSSTHSLYGVACTDCHNPHPRAGVSEFPQNTGVSFLQSNVNHARRLPMSVQEPDACYKCHPKIYALGSLPSHHPVKEGKMTCSDCHDAHGQLEGNIRAEHVTLLCWKCHADKQGPFAYEHPPVTEDCGYCHEPHGTVTNNLLHQPAAFLCLRCHVGHRDGNHGGGARVNIDTIPQIRPGYYTDCTQCHSQIHGSDLPSPHFPGMFR